MDFLLWEYNFLKRLKHKPFFDILNRIRKETGKSTLNETEIDEAANEYLNNKDIVKKKIYIVKE